MVDALLVRADETADDELRAVDGVRALGADDADDDDAGAEVVPVVDEGAAEDVGAADSDERTGVLVAGVIARAGTSGTW